AGNEFQRSLSPSGTITSLNSGLPSRETWTQGPDSDGLLPPLWIIRTLRRLAELHTPSTASLSLTLCGVLPFAVRCEIGTWIAIVWMLSVLLVSTPAAS